MDKNLFNQGKKTDFNKNFFSTKMFALGYGSCDTVMHADILYIYSFCNRRGLAICGRRRF